jgi:hypothetical protein
MLNNEEYDRFWGDTKQKIKYVRCNVNINDIDIVLLRKRDMSQNDISYDSYNDMFYESTWINKWVEV